MLFLYDFLFTACKDEPVQLRAPRKVCIIYGVSGMQQYLNAQLCYFLVKYFYHELIVSKVRENRLYHHQIVLKNTRQLSGTSLIASKCRNTKQLSENNDLFISLVSLSYILAPMEILA